MLPVQQKKTKTTAPEEPQHDSNIYLQVPICQQPLTAQTKSYKLFISQQNTAISPLDQEPPSML